jgi:hypothetical protein
LRPGKIEEGVAGVKIEKRFDWFLLTHNHMGLILFLPYLSRTPLPSLKSLESSIYGKF